MRSSLVLLALLAAGCAGDPPAATIADTPLPHVRMFGASRPADVRSLFVVLHGDHGQPAAPLAEAIAQAPGSAAVTLLRPGFADDQGNVSPGMRGQGNGDSYTADRIDALAAQVRLLRRRYPVARVVLVGEDGGAVLAADLAALRPGIADGLVLVSCPCALPEWRAHMAKRTPGRGWDAPVDSLDPLRSAGGIPTDLRAAVIVGADDKVYAPRFSRAYAEALALRGVAVDYRILPGKAGNVFHDPEVVAAATRLAAALPARS